MRFDFHHFKIVRLTLFLYQNILILLMFLQYILILK